MTDRADWPQTVVSATLASLTPDGGTMTLELAPDELGALLITLTLDGDSASVQVQTETPEAARLLTEAERQLAQDFARQGVTLSSHDAQTGRRGDPGPGASDPTDDPDPSADPAVPMHPMGIINLIA
jgi:flagellar hook-length control protein FliK